MCFSPSCICSSSCSGSLWSLPHYWTSTRLITQLHHLNLLLRGLSSNTTVNACRELTDNLHTFGMKQTWVKTAANPIDINWFQSLFCSAMALQCWISCSLVSTALSQGLWVSTNRRTSVWPNWRLWEGCHSLQWGRDSTANIFPAHASIMMPHSQAVACLEGRSPCLFANTRRAASPTQVFTKWDSSEPLPLPRVLGISGRWRYWEDPAGYSYSCSLETADPGLELTNKALYQCNESDQNAGCLFDQENTGFMSWSGWEVEYLNLHDFVKSWEKIPILQMRTTAQ